jgi:hypothetical protein
MYQRGSTILDLAKGRLHMKKFYINFLVFFCYQIFLVSFFLWNFLLFKLKNPWNQVNNKNQLTLKNLYTEFNPPQISLLHLFDNILDWPKLVEWPLLTVLWRNCNACKTPKIGPWGVKENLWTWHAASATICWPTFLDQPIFMWTLFEVVFC